MNLARATLTLCFLIACNIAFGQTLKIASVSSADRISGKLLEKQLKGKTLELTLYQDSATVVIPALHKAEKLRRTGTDQYTNIINASDESSASRLTVLKTNDQLSAIKLRMLLETEAGDRMDISIVAKPQ